MPVWSVSAGVFAAAALKWSRPFIIVTRVLSSNFWELHFVESADGYRMCLPSVMVRGALVGVDADLPLDGLLTRGLMVSSRRTLGGPPITSVVVIWHPWWFIRQSVFVHPPSVAACGQCFTGTRPRRSRMLAVWSRIWR
jgi:hypothetical protein